MVWYSSQSEVLLHSVVDYTNGGRERGRRRGRQEGEGTKGVKEGGEGGREEGGGRVGRKKRTR